MSLQGVYRVTVATPMGAALGPMKPHDFVGCSYGGSEATEGDWSVMFLSQQRS